MQTDWGMAMGTWFDFANAFFNWIGSLFVIVNARDIYIRKTVAGHTYPSTIFFTVWAIYSIVFYLHLDQFWSFASSVLMSVANIVLLCLVFTYRRT